MDQPKHDSQCLLEKQCGINMKSLQKVKEDGWPFTTSGYMALVPGC